MAPVEASSLHTIKRSVIQVLFFSILWSLAGIVIVFVGETSRELRGPKLWSGALLDQILRGASTAAPWIIPLYVTALLAALAVLLVPDWQQRDANRVAGDELAPVRRAIGSAALLIGPVFVVWGVGIIFAEFLPDVAMGDNAIGVLLALPLVLILTVFVSRASLGTLEQRLADAERERQIVAAWQVRVNRLSYSPRTWIGRHPVRIAALAVLIAGLAGAGLAFCTGVPSLRSALFLLLIVILQIMPISFWASRYREPSPATRRMTATYALLFLGFAVILSMALPWPLSVVALGAIAVPALVYLPRWGGKQLLASTAAGAVSRRSALVNEHHARIQQALRDRDANLVNPRISGRFALWGGLKRAR